MNLQPNALSVDTISLYEQFSGLKLDANRDMRVGFGDCAVAINAMTDNSMGPRSTQFTDLGGKRGPWLTYGYSASAPIKWSCAINLSSS